MTGRELLNALQNMSDAYLDKHVIMEGCDCYGYCGSVDLQDEIYLLRADPEV